MQLTTPRGKNIAICGLDCAECSAYRAHKNDDDELRAETAKKWNEKYAELGVEIKPETVDCTGCKCTSEPRGVFTKYCPVRTCALDQDIDTCCICREFSGCNRRKIFESVTKINIGKEIAKTFFE